MWTKVVVVAAPLGGRLPAPEAPQAVSALTASRYHGCFIGADACASGAMVTLALDPSAAAAFHRWSDGISRVRRAGWKLLARALSQVRPGARPRCARARRVDRARWKRRATPCR